MQVTFSVPANLQGQHVDQLLDPGLTGATRGNGPTGVLGATITLAFPYLQMAISLGFVPTGYIYG